MAEPPGLFDLRNHGLRFFLGVYVLSAVVVGVCRKHEESERAVAVADVFQAQADAAKAHAETMARIEREHLGDRAKADALEAGPLSLWSEALRRAEALRDEGIVGERDFDLTASLRAREVSTRLLIAALRETDVVVRTTVTTGPRRHSRRAMPGSRLAGIPLST
jgi:hypothetical protein